MPGNTLDFYNSHAADYAADGDRPNPRLPIFLKRCKAGGRVLELGTGAGVDAEAILAAGFALDATDGSAELAAIASSRLEQPVRTMLFEELEAVSEYDGIYACASLTHVARDELAGVIRRAHRALVDGGLVWASFKAGDAEGAEDVGAVFAEEGPEHREELPGAAVAACGASLAVARAHGGEVLVEALGAAAAGLFFVMVVTAVAGSGLLGHQGQS